MKFDSVEISEAILDSLTEHTIATEQVFAGKLLDVRRDRVLLPDGSLGIREYIIHPGAVVIIPLLSDGRVLLERQHRYAIRQSVLEFPAGKIDPGEAIEHTARRELLEETGYTAACWRHLGLMHPCIGYANERIEIFLATELSFSGEQRLDPGEFLDVVSFSLEELSEAIREGRLTDAKSITAFFWLEKVLKQGW